MNSPRQTLSYLRNLIEERGIRPKNKLGQNFLVDINLIDLLLRSAELTRDDLVIEVGSGTGALTARLAEQAGAVLSVEVDRDFYNLAGEMIDERPNVVLLNADILATKNELNPSVLAAIEPLRQQARCTQRKLVANLPYSVATPVITNFFLSDVPIERMVVTVQWEIAARMTARPSFKEYGALAVLVQSLAEVEIIRRLSPTVFWPRPQVESAFVLVRPSAALREQVTQRIGNVQRFRTFLRDLYVHRRKNLRGALTSWPTGRRAKDEVDRKLVELGIDGTVRAEALDREQHLRLCEAFG